MKRGNKWKDEGKKEEKYEFHNSTEKMTGIWANSEENIINRYNFDVGKKNFYISLEMKTCY